MFATVNKLCRSFSLHTVFFILSNPEWFCQFSTALTVLRQEHFSSFGVGIVVLVRIVLQVDPPAWVKNGRKLWLLKKLACTVAYAPFAACCAYLDCFWDVTLTSQLWQAGKFGQARLILHIHFHHHSHHRHAQYSHRPALVIIRKRCKP